jgi:hypothetical protein
MQQQTVVVPNVILTGAAAFAFAALVGCSTGPNRVEVPEYDPDKIGARAIELYDDDGDGHLSASEREDVKSLDSAMVRLDANDDDKISAEEIAARIRFYQKYRAGIVAADCTVLRAGRPVMDAKVTYEPESFMGESILPAYGTTNDRGQTVLSMAEEHLPSPVHTGVKPGFYRIRVKLADGTDVTKLNAGAECAGDQFNTHTFVLP